MPTFPYESCFQRVDQEFVTTSFPSSKHDQFVVSGIAPIQLPARKSTLSETIRQRPMRAGCWRCLHANDDKVTACGFRNDVRSRKVVFRPTVWLFREFSVRIINVNGHLCMIDFRSQPEPIFIPFKQLLPNRFPFTRSEVASFGMSHDEKSRQCTRIFTGNSTDSISVAASEIHSNDDVNLLSFRQRKHKQNHLILNHLIEQHRASFNILAWIVPETLYKCICRFWACLSFGNSDT